MKKNIYYLITLCLTIFVVSGCDRFEDSLFDTSSAQRMNEALAKYDQILADPPNGWAMDYYVGNGDAIEGGYRLLVKFKDGAVDMMSEEKVNDLAPGTMVKSSYSFKRDQGPVLSFDTHNNLMHQYATPNSGDLDGMGGDFEFILLEVTPEKVVMKGKKHGLYITLRPLKAEQDWSQYITDVLALRTKISNLLRFTALESSNVVGMVNVERNKFIKTEEEKEPIYRYTLTDKGINLYQPIRIGSKDVDQFEFNMSDNSFTSIEKGTGITLQPEYISYSDFLGDYTISYVGNKGSGQDMATIKALDQGKSFLLSTPTLMRDLVLYYTDGKLTFKPTDMGPVSAGNTNNFWVALGATGLNIYSNNQMYDMYSKWTKGSKPKMEINLVSDKFINLILLKSPIDAIALLQYKGTSNQGAFPNKDGNHIFTNVVLVKK